jgi:protein LSM14
VEFKVPATDFDFMGSNAKFDKAALAAASSKANSTVNGDEGTNGSDDDKVSGEASREDEKPIAYNPSKSFFDSLSSSTHPSIAAGGENGRGGRGRRGGASGQSRRDEERERNVATFGEPGGSYSGWGGYGRRGGRPRRGAPRGGPPQNGTSHVVHARG